MAGEAGVGTLVLNNATNDFTGNVVLKQDVLGLRVSLYEKSMPGYIDEVRRRIEIDGPVAAGDLSERVGKKGTWWDWDDAKVALEQQGSGDPFYTAKLGTARFYFAKLLPETASLIRTARAGAKPLMDMDASLF